MPSWDERFRTGAYPADPAPSPVLRGYLEEAPQREGPAGETPRARALDVACGTGRNAVFLAERGYEVDALDRSIEGLRLTRASAEERGVADRLNLVQADATRFEYPEDRYDVVTISFYRTLDRLGDIKAALRPDGLLFYQHHLRAEPPATVGPSTDRYRFGANELLRACLDLTVLYYEESSERVDGERSATVELVARDSHGRAQSYPETHRDETNR